MIIINTATPVKARYVTPDSLRLHTQMGIHSLRSVPNEKDKIIKGIMIRLEHTLANVKLTVAEFSARQAF